MNEIIININEANKAQKYQSKEELFQIEAFERVSEILKEHKVGRDTNDITDCRFHDTIFIDGDRGVGKTAFMVNIENYYNKYFEMEEKPKYIFLKSVDPTLLEHTEKFLGVILGKIVEMVSKRLKNNSINQDEYFKALENLSKSLSSVSSLENKQDVGIEEIASYKSSQKLEQYAHEFFKIVSTMFGVNAIVMLIDDVDMAFDKGFDVLEVVRKYLASPYLIPIVAGDMKLYREIVETRFKEKIQFFQDVKYLKDLNINLKDNEEYNEKIKLVDNLVEQYLHKVFPSEYHIKLKDIFTILKEYKEKIKIEINGKQISYEDLKDFEIRVINWGINQKEFTHQVFNNNTRDFVQYLYHKKEIFRKIFDENYKPENYKPENNKPYSIITSRFDELIKEKIIDKSEHKKTLKLTADFYRYSNDIDKKRLSLLLDNDVEAFTEKGYSLYKALRGKFFLYEKSPYNKIDKEIVRDKLYVAKDRYKDIKLGKNDICYQTLYLILHDNYYSNVTTKWLIITGKFLESMICILDNTMKREDKIKMINKLKYEIPIFTGINKNKYIDNLSSDSMDGTKIKLNDDDLSNFIDIFDKKFDEVKFSSIFLYEMLKKYMNNINILKASTYSKKNEDIDAKEVNSRILQTPIYDTVKRIIYIFLNAVSSFESTKLISIENIGVDGDVNNIETNSRPFLININQSNSDSVTKTLFSIFKEHLLETHSSDTFKLNEEDIFNLPLESKKYNIKDFLVKQGFSDGMAYSKRINLMNNLIDKIKKQEFEEKFLKSLLNDSFFKKQFIDYSTGSASFKKNKETYKNTVTDLIDLINNA